jgi:hypothetical protein
VTEDGQKNGGILARGQITTETVGGWAEIRIAIRDTLILAAIAAARTAFVLVVTLLAGPWALIVLAPQALRAIVAWFEPDWSDWDRYTLAVWGIVPLVALALLPDAALFWWPWRWQVNRATWWGLLWPQSWPAVIPSVVLLRCVLLTAIVKAWAESWYLVTRLRQEIVAPTLSGTTYEQAAPHAIEIPGVHNPHRNPDAPAPASTGGDLVVRYVPARELDDDARENQRVEAVFPLAFVTRQGEERADVLRRVEGLADVLQAQGSASRAVLMRLDVTSDGARSLQAWMSERGYAEDRGDGNGYVVTDLGRRWLGIVERHLPPF